MKSKISFWRLVRSMAAWLPIWVDGYGPTNVCSQCIYCKGRIQGASAGTHQAPPPRGYTRALCARGGIGRRARLRALWGVFPVVVRVHSGACERPCDRTAFLFQGLPDPRADQCSDRAIGTSGRGSELPTPSRRSDRYLDIQGLERPTG